ncbi:MAG: DUF3488 and transglutaminase-like domain-containing protein [Phycisphaerae bacterium]|nr:DUF3488 and transglutaminase-like domain-containing protein [Phycisphaerae bacterium]
MPQRLGAPMNRYDRKLALAVYGMVLLAVLNMVLAEGTIVYFALACVAAMISWPIAHGRSSVSAVPRWLISLAVLTALAFFLFELGSRQHPINALAHFMIFVQVCKFFENKRARDYGQLIILSMIEMIVAAILSTSMVFAVLFLGYLALSSYTLLLYHFKREMELFERTGRGGRRTMLPAAAALAEAADSLNGIGPWRFWRFSISAGAVVLAIGVTLFISFPRFGEGWIARTGLIAPRQITGFDDTPHLGRAGTVEQSDELVMRVAIYEGGTLVTPSELLLLRGSVLWEYGARGSWRDRSGIKEPHNLTESTPFASLRYWPKSNITDEREIRIEMRSLRTQCLFAPYPALGIRSETPLALHYNTTSHALVSLSNTPATLNYSVWVPRDARQIRDEPPIPSRHNRVPERITRLAQDWTQGQATDQAKADAIQDRLRRDFSYTLTIEPSGSDDPLEAFLFDKPAGHCQYFASAMAVLCQQSGIPARLITGFKACEFNPQGNYYMVRQKHAHAWVEVYLKDRHGWVTYDPTPGSDDHQLATETGVTGWFKNMTDYLNYRFQQRVLNYSKGDREAVLSNTWTKTTSAYGTFAAWLNRWCWWIAGLVGIVTAAVLLRRMATGRWKSLHRDRLLRDRGLGFWADLLVLLGRAKIEPAIAMTPRELAAALASRWPQMPGLDGLGDLYYDVRYGEHALPPAEEAGVRETLASLSQVLFPRKARA